MRVINYLLLNKVTLTFISKFSREIFIFMRSTRLLVIMILPYEIKQCRICLKRDFFTRHERKQLYAVGIPEKIARSEHMACPKLSCGKP